MKTLALIEAPICVGAPTLGTENAYQKLIESGLPDLLGSCTLYPMDLTAEERSAAAGQTKTGDFPNDLLHLDSCTLVSEKLRKTVKMALQSGDFPVTLGGDHSVCMGTLAALSETYGAENIALIYIDAHADCNTPETSESHRIHGMDLAEAMGLTGDRLNIGDEKINLLGKNVYYFGMRSVDPPEWNIIHENGMHVFSAEDLGLTLPVGLPGQEKKSPEEIEANKQLRTQKIREAIQTVLPDLYGKKVLISLDVDSMDGEVFPATGYRIPNGFTLDEVMTILTSVIGVCHAGMDGNTVCPYGELAAFECVEYNPSLDPDDGCLLKLFALLSILQSVYTHGLF